MIPKIIHYCWFGKNPLPRDVKQCIASWKKYCPEYEIKQWDESNFDVTGHPFIKSAYEAKAWAFVSDYARLKVVHEYGGIYLDTDVELVKEPDFLLGNLCYIGVQCKDRLCNTGLGFGAEKSSPVIYDMLKLYDSISFEQENREAIACPGLNHQIIRSYGYQDSDEIVYLKDVTVYPPRYFDPYPSGVNVNLFNEDTVSIHHYSATWTSGSQRIKRKIARIIGEDKIVLLKKCLKRK